MARVGFHGGESNPPSRAVNFYGTVISDTPIELTRTRHSYANCGEREYSPVGPSRISTGDYDAVIIGHSQFEKIPVSRERQKRVLSEEIEEIVDCIEEIKRNRGERFTIKQLEKSMKNLEAKLQKLNDDSRNDDVVTFEELGADRLFVDEAHGFKNLYLFTKMRNVAGISQTEAKKSSGLMMKCRYIDEITGSRGIVFATGTPVSKSMAELYTMQRYLQYEELRAGGCSTSTRGLRYSGKRRRRSSSRRRVPDTALKPASPV